MDSVQTGQGQDKDPVHIAIKILMDWCKDLKDSFKLWSNPVMVSKALRAHVI